MRKTAVILWTSVMTVVLSGCENFTNVENFTLETAEETQEPEETQASFALPTQEQVEAARALALEGMSEDEIKRLKENIKVANQAMEKAYLSDNIFKRLSDRDSLYWNYIDQTGDIQIGWTYNGEEITAYNRFDADNFMELMEDMKGSIRNEELADCLDRMIESMEDVKTNREVESLEDIYKLLHDMDYYLLRYGPEDVGKYVEDGSLIGTYYGTLPFYNTDH